MESATAERERLTTLLVEASGGNVDALNELFPLVYGELRRLARNRLRAEREGHTLSTTALVHESYLKLVDQTRVEWRNRAHFYAVAARAMRRILVNHAEARNAAKRGGGVAPAVLDDDALPADAPPPDQILAVHEALERLEAFNQRGAEVVTYRFFGGLTHEEIAEVMELSPVTVRRSWTAAKSWLRRELAS
jgi:RNA polymerase sigma factor (TIGR02999 family)